MYPISFIDIRNTIVFQWTYAFLYFIIYSQDFLIIIYSHEGN